MTNILVMKFFNNLELALLDFEKVLVSVLAIILLLEGQNLVFRGSSDKYTTDNENFLDLVQVDQFDLIYAVS